MGTAGPNADQPRVWRTGLRSSGWSSSTIWLRMGGPDTISTVTPVLTAEAATVERVFPVSSQTWLIVGATHSAAAPARGMLMGRQPTHREVVRQVPACKAGARRVDHGVAVFAPPFGVGMAVHHEDGLGRRSGRCAPRRCRTGPIGIAAGVATRGHITFDGDDAADSYQSLQVRVFCRCVVGCSRQPCPGTPPSVSVSTRVSSSVTCWPGMPGRRGSRSTSAYGWSKLR